MRGLPKPAAALSQTSRLACLVRSNLVSPALLTPTSDLSQTCATAERSDSLVRMKISFSPAGKRGGRRGTGGGRVTGNTSSSCFDAQNWCERKRNRDYTPAFQLPRNFPQPPLHPPPPILPLHPAGYRLREQAWRGGRGRGVGEKKRQRKRTFVTRARARAAPVY